MTSYSSKGQSYLTIEGKWIPNLSIFKFEFIPHLDTFLFEIRNVTAACSTIVLFKNSYFNDYQGLCDSLKGNLQVEANHVRLLFFNLIDLSSKISVSNAF